MSKQKRGFTLVELLVVIAIIGILSSIVLANLNGSRQAARDVKRISDVKQLQLALELYFDANSGKYPGQLSDLLGTYIGSIPTPPGGVSGAAANYVYVPLKVGNGVGTCNGYHLGAALEQSTNSVLTNDADENGGTVGSSCSGSAVTASSDFNGAGALCDTNGGGDSCYDVTP